MKKEFIFSMLLAASLPAAAAHHGRVFVDKNHNGSFDKGEKVLKDVKVSDGLNVVKTDANGMYILPGHERERFVFITLPSGYKAGDKHYHPITAAAGNYDFGLIPYQAGIDKKGAHRFIQVSDTEIFNTTGNEAWAENIRQYAANEKPAFIIHTGDICYEKGLKEHIELMNTQNMNIPMFYCIGNHDLVKENMEKSVSKNTTVRYIIHSMWQVYTISSLPCREEITARDIPKTMYAVG